MELFIRNDRLFIVDCAILSQAAQVIVVEDAWDD